MQNIKMKDIPITSPEEEDLPEFPSPVKAEEGLDGVEIMAYPYLTETAVHARSYSVQHRDKTGWGFSWCDSAEEAKERTKPAMVKANWLTEARRLRARFTGDAKPAKLPAEVTPPPPSEPTIEDILVQLGVRNVILDGGIRESVEAPWVTTYESPDTMGTRDSRSEGSVTWIFPEEEKVRVPASITPEDLLKGGSRNTPWTSHGRGVGGSGGFSGYGPVALDLGCTLEQIQETVSWIEGEKERREKGALAELQRWFTSLESHPAFHCLSPKTLELCREIAMYGWGYTKLQTNLAHLEVEWGKALAVHAQKESGDILSNWEALWRTGGATHCGRAYVVRPDGSLREADRREGLRRPTREILTWEFVAPEELAISWGRMYSAAPDEFTVAKLPKGGCTSGQLETVSSLEREILNNEGGEGWNLTPKKQEKAKKDSFLSSGAWGALDDLKL